MWLTWNKEKYLIKNGFSCMIKAKVTAIFGSSSEGGKIDAKNSVKLACKQFFAPIFPWGGHPVLLDWSFSVRKLRPLNSYGFLSYGTRHKSKL